MRAREEAAGASWPARSGRDAKEKAENALLARDKAQAKCDQALRELERLRAERVQDAEKPAIHCRVLARRPVLLVLALGAELPVRHQPLRGRLVDEDELAQRRVAVQLDVRPDDGAATRCRTGWLPA